MAISTGKQIGPYEVLAPLGAGGMGEVYRARDGRLNREVAIKVLPASFANDEDRLRRFKQEAQATSALNHPNILTIYDIGTASSELGGAPYIVAELLEGERKPWPWLNTPFIEDFGRFSTDGKWIAYQSNESGRNEKAFAPGAAASGGKWQLSTGGSQLPSWRRDGRELYFVSPDNKLMAVDI
ncbi:MAG: protein kinase domain-containing protein, partial [Blastocatellia bacterium]